MTLTEAQRVLIRERIASLTVEHYRKLDRLVTDFEAERRRLEEMLRLGFVPQRLPRSAA